MILPYMVPNEPQTFITEEYVSSPPAARIVDETGAHWALGFEYGPAPAGEFAFSVLRNGKPTGEFASRIERRGGRIRIFTVNGFKHWTGRSFA